MVIARSHCKPSVVAFPSIPRIQTIHGLLTWAMSRRRWASASTTCWIWRLLTASRARSLTRARSNMAIVFRTAGITPRHQRLAKRWRDARDDDGGRWFRLRRRIHELEEPPTSLEERRVERGGSSFLFASADGGGT